MTEGDSLDNLAATADPAYERQVDELMEKIMADVDENTRARQEGRTGTHHPVGLCGLPHLSGLTTSR